VIRLLIAAQLHRHLFVIRYHERLVLSIRLDGQQPASGDSLPIYAAVGEFGLLARTATARRHPKNVNELLDNDPLKYIDR